jgi:hypothetical protein
VERRVAEQLAAGTAAGWEDRLNGSGIAAAAVCTDLAEVAADPRLSHLFEPVGIGGVAPKAPWTFA